MSSVQWFIGITSYAIAEDKTIATIQNNEREIVTINSFNLKGIDYLIIYLEDARKADRIFF